MRVYVRVSTTRCGSIDGSGRHTWAASSALSGDVALIRVADKPVMLGCVSVLGVIWLIALRARMESLYLRAWRHLRDTRKRLLESNLLA